MLTINVNDNGEINISQETAGERRLMAEFYNEQDRQRNQVVYESSMEGSTDEPSEIDKQDFDTPENQDELNAVWFKSGWDSALRECMDRFATGTIIDFFNEVGVAKDPSRLLSAAEENFDSYGQQDPHHDEPEGTGEAGYPSDDYEGLDTEDEDSDESPWGSLPKEAFVDARPVVDSGEPEVEMNQTWDPEDTGTWTMSSEELQSRLDEAYNRGNTDGRRGKQSITRRTLLAKVNDVIAAETIGAFASDKAVPVSTQLDKVFGESMEAFVVPLAKSLGFKVVD